MSPVLADPAHVLSTLTHELIHAAVGNKCGHRGAFRRVALDVGFTPPMKSTPVGPELKTWLADVAAKLGPYPHATLDPSQRKKQSTRLVKCECAECGYTARVTRKWIESAGPPLCPCNSEAMLAS